MPGTENSLELACRVATLRLERGYLVKIYDVSSADSTKTLRRQLGEKYDLKKVRNRKALQTSGMFDAIHYGTEVYRNELVKSLHHLGYSLRRTGSVFEIEGVSPKLIEQFSKRAKERDAAVAKEEKRLGRKLTKD